MELTKNLIMLKKAKHSKMRLKTDLKIANVNQGLVERRISNIQMMQEEYKKRSQQNYSRVIEDTMLSIKSPRRNSVSLVDKNALIVRRRKSNAFVMGLAM
jgi:hypothetical protein